MRDPAFYVASLLELATAPPNERRALWRQAMAALSRASTEEGPSPLEGLHPDVLVKGVQVALQSGLVDDLDWLSPAAAGVGLYMLAAALPVGPVQRDLGRRVLSRLLAANAETFTAVVTVMAQTGGKGLASAGMRARIGLVCELPLAAGISDGPLAHALVGRREYAREWVAGPSTRSLPARRLAAKLLERAAREVARRAQMGDTHALRIFSSDAVAPAFERLLADRESLVWRYVAVARGLGAAWVPEFRAQMQDGLREGLSPTEWRRSVASLAAFAAVRPDEALKTLQALVKRGFFTNEDPGSALAFVWGLPRAIEAEPEAATKMLDVLFEVAHPDVGEAIAELPREYGASKVVEHAAKKALALLRSEHGKPRGDDDGAVALGREILRDLDDMSAARDQESIREQVRRALEIFATEGAQAAHARARDLVVAAGGSIDALEVIAKDDDLEDGSGSIARRTSMAVLRDLDMGLLERHVVGDLLKLGGSAEQVRASEEAFDAVRERIGEWIVLRETPDEVSSDAKSIAHPTLRLRRLRALLHLVDGDLSDGGAAVVPVSRPRIDAFETGEAQRAERLRVLWLRLVRALLEHFERGPSPVFARTLLATLARALDALLRLGGCDVIDAFLVLSQRIKTAAEFDALAEASMDPDLRHVLSRYARFLRESEAPARPASTDAGDSLFPRSDAPRGPTPKARLEALERFAGELSLEASARSEALRTVLVRLHAALSAVVTASSLRALAPHDALDPDVVAAVETWAVGLAQMCAGAAGRIEKPKGNARPSSPPQVKALGAAVARVLAGTELTLTDEILAPAIDALSSELPVGIGRLLSAVLWTIGELPIERPSREGVALAAPTELPAWLPARRTLGGFYVVRALGVGGTASVFVVHRVEDRHDPKAERFALKVPDYTATAARSVSQEEFLKLFRDEASALIMLPNHANLARFVTFDLSSRPLPILVMELVEGVTLERVIAARTFDMKKCIEALDDVLAGLEAMHSAGLGHLDLKPSNVVLRRGEQAVLVDFGLAGRKIRSGCGTGPYGAPEIWGVAPKGMVPTPMAADIYSFACLAFELVTGRVLFDAPNAVAQISLHVSHDGAPPPVRALVDHPEVRPLMELLVYALQPDPRRRPSAEALRRELRAVAPMLENVRWPVPLPAKA